MCSCQEVLLRGFSVLPFFSRSIFLKAGTVYDRPSNMWAKPSPTESKPGRMPIYSRLKVFSRSDMDIHPLCGLPFHVFRQVPFSSYTDLVDFSQICLHLCLPPFLRLPVSRISHFRSGRKGNSGIGRKCKVKPPVFSKNLQPFG